VAWQLGDVETVDEDLAGAEVEHAEEGHGQGGLSTGRTLALLLRYMCVMNRRIFLPSGSTTQANLVTRLDGQ
jgi:hypothetical protein